MSTRKSHMADKALMAHRRETRRSWNDFDATKPGRAGVGLVCPEAFQKRRVPTYVQAKRERLYRATLTGDALALREGLIAIPARPLNEPVVADAAKKRKYKGRTIARRLVY